MPTKNEEYTVTITGTGSQGEGVCKIDGYTVFVPFATVGDNAKIKIVKAGKHYGYGKLLSIVQPSADRTEPCCQQFGKCGGCTLMHLSADAQARWKRQKVVDALERIGGFHTPKVHETVCGLEKTHYRNKVQLPVATAGTGEIQCGFYAPRSHRIVQTEHCVIQEPVNQIIISAVLEWMRENKISAYDSESHTGVVRHIYTRLGKRSGELLISIIGNASQLPCTDALKEKLTGLDFTPFHLIGIVFNSNQKQGNTILGEELQVLYGRSYIYDNIGGLQFKISHHAFFQVNPETTELLYRKAIELCGLTGEEAVFDLYCGSGTISLFAAQKAKQVIGVESVPAAIEDAIENAERNGIQNAEFYIGKAEEIVPALYEKGIKADVVIVDPPRKGCDGILLRTIVDMQPQKVVYVSCDPATMARDAKFLCENGYELVECTPVDQFPYTYHVESVALLQRRSGSLGSAGALC